MGLFDSYPQNYNQNQNLQRPQIDPVRLRQAVSMLDQNSLNQLIQQARLLGIPNEQIQAGLEYMRNI